MPLQFAADHYGHALYVTTSASAVDHLRQASGAVSIPATYPFLQDIKQE